MRKGPATVHLLGSAFVAILLIGSVPVRAAETARFINAPAPVAAQPPKLAAQFELKLVIHQGKGLARQLLDAGVDQADAADTARLAAGHLGDGTEDCFAKVSVVRVSANSSLSLVRVMLTTDSDQTVLERRDGQLAIASQVAMRKSPRLI
ncbi:MAG: hypothetical protein JO335_07370 [Sphingomonas sp.]|nr:hypothetical protein [Sphingomonas sp.]